MIKKLKGPCLPPTARMCRTDRAARAPSQSRADRKQSRWGQVCCGSASTLANWEAYSALIFSLTVNFNVSYF